MGLDALDYEAGVLRDQAASMKEYAALKGRLLWRTQRAGAALAAYLLLTVSGEVHCCALLEIRWTHAASAQGVEDITCKELFSCCNTWL